MSFFTPMQNTPTRDGCISQSVNCKGGCLRGHYNHGGLVTPNGRWGLTHGGDFAGGFSLMALYASEVTAMAWSFNHTVSAISGKWEPEFNRAPNRSDYDVYTLVHRGM